MAANDLTMASPPPPPLSPVQAQPLRPKIKLQPPSKKTKSSTSKLVRRFRSVIRSLPIITGPSCKIPVSLHGSKSIMIGDHGHIHGGIRMSGTLFGYRKARVNLAIQETTRSFPVLLLELSIPTGKLLQDMGMEDVRIALECKKKPSDKTKIVDEPIWTLYYNGKKVGYGVKREPSDDDLDVMQLLHPVSMGAGVIPREVTDPQDGDLTYMRAHLERVIGSKDSETYYMMNPDGNGNGSELTMFFVRI